MSALESKALDTAPAEAYEAQLVKLIFGPWAEAVVALADPKPGENILDAACGTGIGARLAYPRAQPGGRVVGLDNDAGVIAVARRLATQGGLAIEWLCESALALPFADRSFDLALCLQGPQFLSDPAIGLAELHRVLKPSGRLAASFWCAMEHNKGHYALGQALRQQGIPPATKPFSMGDSAEAKRLFSDAGFQSFALETRERQFRVPSVEAFVDAVAAGAPATRHALAKLSAEQKPWFIADVKKRLAPYADAEGLTLPTRCHIVLARP